MVVFDIATLGTSLTAGSGATMSYHRDLAAALRIGKSSTVRLYNFGIPGGYTSDGLANVQKVADLRPRVVLVEFTMNDCLISQATAQANTISLLNQLKSKSPGSDIFLLILNKVVGSSPSATSRSNLPAFNQMYRDLAASQNVGLIDTYSAWGPAGLSDIPDGVHPTPEANRLYAVPGIAGTLSSLVP